MTPIPAIPTISSATANLPALVDAGLEAFMDAWLDAATWRDRMDLADAIFADWADVPATLFRAQAGSRLLTSLLEQLGERSIECAEAAALYRVADHDCWRIAACRWFAGHPSVLPGFMADHPGWAIFAAQAAVLHR
jgi:hypothetical protein